MNRSYGDWLNIAAEHKARLNIAAANGNSKDIIYFRGKYLFDLKQAYKINPRGVVPKSITGYNSDVAIDSEIQNELRNHQLQIDSAIRENKKESDISNPTLINETGLKIQRLATRASQVNFATGHATGKDIVKDSLGLVGTAIKAPVMVAAKVASKVGPLAITIIGLPFTLLASALSVTIDISKGTVSDGEYNNTIIHHMSNALKKGVKNLSENLYKGIGKI